LKWNVKVSCETVWTVLRWIKYETQELIDKRLDLTNANWAGSEGPLCISAVSYHHLMFSYQHLRHTSVRAHTHTHTISRIIIT
jgi:hypothetical protein